MLMNKTLVFIFTFVMSNVAFAQNKVLSKAAQDSLEDMALLKEMIGDLDKPTSYFYASIGVGNKLFSVKNNTANSSQTQVKKLYYTPSIAYYHKSGFNISLTPYITTDSGKIKVYQTALTPAYDYEGTKFSSGISYTRYIADHKSYNTNSIYQNDLFAYLTYTKPFLQPSISLGFSGGKYKEINIDSIKIAPNQYKKIRDSTDNTIRDFSLSIGVEHSFEFDSVFSKNDLLTFIPQLVLNAGSEKFTTTHTNKAFAALLKKSKQVRRSLSSIDNSPFAIQSLALSLDVLYEINNFTIAPNLYIDYYLPATTEKRTTAVFSLSVGYSF
jgi:hypothetical protein